MREDFRVRYFQSEDVASVQRLNQVFLPEHYPIYFFHENHRRFPKAFLVAEIKGSIVGYVMCRVEKAFLWRKTLNMGHVLSVAVDRNYRRRGIGRALMIEAEKNLRSEYGCNLIYLEVRVSNEPAINLYKKLGYRKLGVIPRYYHDGEDAYLMFKIVSPDTTERDVMESLGGRVRERELF